MGKMLDLLEECVRKAEGMGCKQVEAYGEYSRALLIEFENNEVSKVKETEGNGIGVRVALPNGKIGFSYTSSVMSKDLHECVEKAMKQAKASYEDKSFRGFPSGVRKYTDPAGVFDRDVVDLEIEKGIELCEQMIEAAIESGRGKIDTTEGGFTAGYDNVFIVNSEGVEVSDRGTYISGGLTAVIGKVSAWEGLAKRNLREFDAEWIGKEAAEIAVKSMNPRKMEGMKADVVLSPKAVNSLLSFTTIPQLSAENVQMNRSPYKGRMGEKIASEGLTVRDDGTMAGGLNTRKMDGEGVPSQNTVLIERGVLKNFMYDSYTAGIDDVESTGNAFRSYDSPPAIGATNFIIQGDEDFRMKEEEMLAEARNGILINDVIGAHTASRASGEFSVLAYDPFLIEGGELIPVRNVMITGSSTEILEKIKGFGEDYRQIGSIFSPSLLVEGIDIIG